MKASGLSTQYSDASCRLVLGCAELVKGTSIWIALRVLDFRIVGPALATHIHWSRWIHFLNVCIHGLLGIICRICISCITQLPLFVTIANPLSFIFFLNTPIVCYIYLHFIIAEFLIISVIYNTQSMVFRNLNCRYEFRKSNRIRDLLRSFFLLE